MSSYLLSFSIPIFITISISSAPFLTASAVSKHFTSVVLYPFGKPITVQILILPPTYSFAGFTYAGGMQTLAALYLTASSQIDFISCQVAPCAKSVWSTFESMFCLFICVSLL